MNRSVFVYEHLSGGPPGGADAADEALLPEGLAMRDAIVADLLRAGDCDVTVAQRETVGHAPPDGAALRMVRAGDVAEDVLATAARTHGAVWVVAPETDRLLERFARCVPAERWIGCSRETIALASSKKATLAALAAHAVPTPHLLVDEARQWVVKPDDGAGSLATRRHDTLAAAQADAAARAQPCVVEPWVDGEAMSLSLLGGPMAAHLLSVNRQQVRVEADGTVQFDGVEPNVLARQDPRRTLLAALAHRVLRALPGLRGFFGIDFVWHPQRGPVVIEINPRLTSAFVGLSGALGCNVGAAVLHAHREGRDG